MSSRRTSHHPMARRRSRHAWSLRSAFVLGVLALGALLALACLTGCEPMDMAGYGSTSTSSHLWEQEVPEGGGALLVTGDDDNPFWATYIFDANGRLVTSETYTSDGATWRLSNYTYDDQGRITTISGNREGGGHDTAASFEEHYTYTERDDGGIDIEERDSDGSTSTWSYDASGLLLSQSGDSGRTEYEYDDQGRLTARWEYTSRGGEETISWINSMTCEYGTDAAGDWERCYGYDEESGQANHYYEYRFDDEGTIVSSQAFELQEDGTWAASGEVETLTHAESLECWPGTQTPKTRTVTETSSDPTRSRSYTTTYDEDGRPISSTRTYGESSAVRHAEYKGTVPEGFLDDELFSPDVVLRSCGVTEEVSRTTRLADE